MSGREYTGAALYIDGVKVADVESYTVIVGDDRVDALPLDVYGGTFRIDTTISRDDAAAMFATLFLRRGRVRWRRFTGEPERARMFVVGPLRVGDVVPVGDGWDATVYGTDERETFTRRRAATRWLLARAAGLAEVPRRESFGTPYGSPQTKGFV